MRYRPGEHMFNEDEMAWRIRRLRRTLHRYRGFDILLTHAPIRGLGDQEDLPHRGFECFRGLLDRYEATVMIHGHVHRSYTTSFVRSREYNGVEVINACGAYFFDLPERRNKKEPSRWVGVLERRQARKMGLG